MLKSVTAASTLLLSLLWADSAFALSLWNCIPVPEIDGASGLAAIALVMSFGGIVHRKLLG
jgi:hypothetical protein